MINILIGEEQIFTDSYINSFNYQYLNSSEEAYMQSKKMHKDKEVYYVIDDKEFISSEKAQNSILRHFLSSEDTLLIRYNKIDKKTKFYANNKKYIIEFNKQPINVLCDEVSKILPQFKYAKELINLCESDYGRILLEIDKIKRLAEVENIDYNKAYDTIKKDLKPKYTIFDLTDAILYGDINKSIQIVSNIEDVSTVAVSTILYNGFRNLLLYQGLGKDKSNIMQRTGLTNWEINKCQKLVGGYNTKDLNRNMYICQELESKIKLGLLDDKLSLEYLIVRCLE